ncbi:MAG: Creatininase [Xanthobacteraceae bacterium]|nr:Creatininase [Xanthobacteraceae bacterium]
MLPKRDWMAMAWPDFAGADTARWIAVLPLAAVEQHGPHLPLGVDSYIGDAYLARVRALIPEDLPASFMPVQWIGQSDEHLAFPGTLNFSATTVIRAWTEIGESVHRAGVRKLVLVTSHGGNVPAMDIVSRDLRARLGMLVVTVGWHRFGYPDGAFTATERRHGIHAGDVETSIMLAAEPDTVRRDKVADFPPATLAMERDFQWLNAGRPAGFGWMTQDLHPSGALGDATQATAAKGEAALNHGAQSFVELLQEVDRFDLSKLAPGPLGNGAANR